MDEKNLLLSRRLVLLVDLDQTLIHTTNENVNPGLKVIIGVLEVCFTIFYSSSGG